MGYAEESYNSFLREVKNLVNKYNKLSIEEKHHLSCSIAALYILYCDKHEDYIFEKLKESLSK